MHRSGTSLLCRLLEELGLFVGAKKEGNNESVFFQKLNIWVIRQTGGRWDVPAPVNYLLEDKETLSLVEEYLFLKLKTLPAISYLGWKNYMKYRDIFALDFPWGWKDPRNTFTLPVWLHLFPEATVIYIERHGVDVANSLKVRREKGKEISIERFKKYRKLYALYPKKGGFSHSLRCGTLERSFSLWEEYVNQGRSLINNLPKNQCFSLTYEDLLANGEKHLRNLVSFCELPFSESKMEKAIQKLDKGRAYAYRSSPELVQFAESVSDRLRGYEP